MSLHTEANWVGTGSYEEYYAVERDMHLTLAKTKRVQLADEFVEFGMCKHTRAVIKHLGRN